jgi:anhydro-N-acetylmuramic acid kinase
MKRLLEIAAKNVRHVLGLMSGTSADGTDAALVKITASGPELSWELLAFEHRPYPDELRDELLQLFDSGRTKLSAVIALDNRITREFAAAGLEAMDRAGLAPGGIDLIGSHGQTLWHAPPRMAGPEKCGSWQAGSAPVLAEALGAPVVHDFHSRDIAVGGEGAPLVPYADFLLLRHQSLGRATLNLGGTADVAYLPPDCSAGQILAFDTGPGNMVIDETVRAVTGGSRNYDPEGRMASEGRISTELLDELLRHPFFRRQPPRSTGREEFGSSYATTVLGKGRHMGMSDSDILATVTVLTARSIGDGIKSFVLPAGKLDEVIVSGGGVHNALLMKLLEVELPAGVSLRSSDEFGLPVDAKEAIAHAVLANETISGRPANLPGATGAARPVLLGSIVP